MARYGLALDLKNDDALTGEYIRLHKKIWPEVCDHLREAGITSLEIFHLGTRLFMLMETDDKLFSFERKAALAAGNAKVDEWEALMWKFQAATPWTPEGEKWVLMNRIFDLSLQ